MRRTCSILIVRSRGWLIEGMLEIREGPNLFLGNKRRDGIGSFGSQHRFFERSHSYSVGTGVGQ